MAANKGKNWQQKLKKWDSQTERKMAAKIKKNMATNKEKSGCKN